MKETLEDLWRQYFSEECAVVDSEEERKLARVALEMHNRANERPAQSTLEEYSEALCALHSFQIRKAFFKGCEFAAAFLIGVFGKA